MARRYAPQNTQYSVTQRLLEYRTLVPGTGTGTGTLLMVPV